MAHDKVRVAFVGGGRTGTPLMRDFLRRPFIEVVGLADIDPESPGAKLAAENGIFLTDDALYFASKGDEVDVLIDAVGDPVLKRRIKNAFIAEGNKHTILVHDLVARTMMSMASNSPTLVETYHPEDNGVG